MEKLDTDLQRILSGLSVDDASRFMNVLKELERRKEKKRKAEHLLIKSRATERILYAIAYENVFKGDAGIIYMHASNRNEAIGEILLSRTLHGSRIVAIAPAVGSWSTDGKVAVV